MNDWQKLLQQSLTTFSDLKKHLNCDDNTIEDVIAQFPMRINPYFLQLIKKKDDPIWKQAVPDPLELSDNVCVSDPLGEENLSPVENIVHKYPDRVLLLVTSQCAMYCRFCTRKRKVGTSRMHITSNKLQQCYQYIKNNTTIREVLISGGDPLLLTDEQLDEVLWNLKQIEHLQVIRIGSRVPSTLPMRVTDDLVSILKKYHPLYINTHFNHPIELTEEATKSCNKLADAGIPLGNHTVLLKGVNDDLITIRTLLLGLLRIRVKPYYLFQADLTCGTNHFRTPIADGIAIMRGLIGHISGMAVPTFAVDAPGGKGKIPLTPNYILEHGEDLIFNNFKGEICYYPDA